MSTIPRLSFGWASSSANACWSHVNYVLRQWPAWGLESLCGGGELPWTCGLVRPSQGCSPFGAGCALTGPEDVGKSLAMASMRLGTTAVCAMGPAARTFRPNGQKHPP